MGRVSGIKRGFFCVAFFAVGTTAGLFLAEDARSLPEPDYSPAEIVALRFPDDWNAVGSIAAGPVLASAGDEIQQVSLFDSSPMYTPEVVPQRTAPVVAQASAAPMARALPGRPKVAPNPIQHTASRSSTVLNDAQIATIKKRLNLTADQERMWPAVEVALRQIAWKKGREAARNTVAARAGQAGTIDPNSPEVQQLKSAAFPLVMSFSSDQKQEVKAFARIVGLDSVASQF